MLNIYHVHCLKTNEPLGLCYEVMEVSFFQFHQFMSLLLLLPFSLALLVNRTDDFIRNLEVEILSELGGDVFFSFSCFLVNISLNLLASIHE